MIDLFDLNGDELTLVSFLISEYCAQVYTCQQVAILAAFATNLGAQLAVLSVKGLFDTAQETNASDTSTSSNSSNS